MRRQTFLAAVSLMALSFAAPALAQSSTPLTAGQTVQGQIAEGDATGPDDAFRYDSYAINARAYPCR